MHELCMSGHGCAFPRPNSLGHPWGAVSWQVGLASGMASFSLWALPGLSYRHLDKPGLHWALLRPACALTLPILVMHLLFIRVLESLAIAAVPAWGWR